jgi:hypothetical protein
MQRTNKRTVKVPKRLKLSTDELNTNGIANDETTAQRAFIDRAGSCEPATEDHTTESPTPKHFNNSPAEHNITEPQEILSEGIHQESTDGIMTEFLPVHYL